MKPMPVITVALEVGVRRQPVAAVISACAVKYGFAGASLTGVSVSAKDVQFPNPVWAVKDVPLWLTLRLVFVRMEPSSPSAQVPAHTPCALDVVAMAVAVNCGLAFKVGIERLDKAMVCAAAEVPEMDAEPERRLFWYWNDFSEGTVADVALAA